MLALALTVLLGVQSNPTVSGLSRLREGMTWEQVDKALGESISFVYTAKDFSRMSGLYIRAGIWVEFKSGWLASVQISGSR
jgi:hypothetical protein